MVAAIFRRASLRTCAFYYALFRFGHGSDKNQHNVAEQIGFVLLIVLSAHCVSFPGISVHSALRSFNCLSGRTLKSLVT